MTVSGITDYYGYDADAYLEADSGDELGKDDFLQLIIAQLEYQDPLEPVGSTEFMSQVTSMGQLEQLQNLNSNFEEMMTTNSLVFGSQLVGQTVQALDEETGLVVEGEVGQVSVQDGEVLVQVGSYLFNMDDIVAVIPWTSSNSILQASQMVGLNVTAYDPNDSLEFTTVSGIVTEASVSDGTIMLTFTDSESGKEYEIELGDILTVGQAATTESEEE